ncbi:MAG TPA: hypothetical protein VHC73_05770 [Vitreimonas sp.]|jgi:hypothetical protein|nr:hypothetical protein [Vitreimonas sp.]
MRTTLLLAASCALAFASAVPAQPAPAHGALFIAPMGQPFRASGDETGVQKWFAEADTDHDGKISLAEFVADADAFLPHVDSNGDGVITSTESDSLWREQAPEVISNDVSYDAPLDPNTPIGAGEHHHTSHPSSGGASWGGLVSAEGGRTHGPGGPRPIGAQAFGLLGDPEPIMACDTNFDRRIEKTEFEQCAARRFVELDTNHDGFFTTDEVHPWLTAQGRVEH